MTALLCNPPQLIALQARYSPSHRVDQLRQLGHSVDKEEFTVSVGTFMALPEEYRTRPDYHYPKLHLSDLLIYNQCLLTRVRSSQRRWKRRGKEGSSRDLNEQRFLKRTSPTPDISASK